MDSLLPASPLQPLLSLLGPILVEVPDPYSIELETRAGVGSCIDSVWDCDIPSNAANPGPVAPFLHLSDMIRL